MPELPEVDEVRRTLAPCLLGVRVLRVDLLRPDYARPATGPAGVAGHSATTVFRHGKKLFVVFDDGQTLVLHLGMTGRLDCGPTGGVPAAHTHLVLELENQTAVRMIDPRRFGGVWWYATRGQAVADQTNGLGIDALELAPHHLAHWRTCRGRLKARLLSQRDVAGLGNIYVDEALWLARLHPLQHVHRLTETQKTALARAARKVLERSIAAGGTTLRDYRNVQQQKGAFARQLKAYGRANQPCRRCQTPLRGIRVAGRATVFCPTCQKRC